jgi:hypothetical protein
MEFEAKVKLRETEVFERRLVADKKAIIFDMMIDVRI